MTKTEAVAEIRRILGFRTDQSDNIILGLRRAQRLLELGQSLPWFLISEDAVLTGAADVAYVAFPTGFIREVDDEPWYFTMTGDDSTTKLKKVPYDQLLDIGRNPETSEEETGVGIYYAIRTTRFYVRPIPTAAWTMTGSYYKAADTLDSASTNNWLTYAPEVLYGAAAMSMARDLRDDYAYKTAETLFKEASARVLADTITREYGNREQFMGGQA